MIAAALLLGSILSAPAAVDAAPFAGRQSIVVGTQRLSRCKIAVEGYCGRLRVPLNWLDASQGTISILYQWLPARGGASGRTILAESGGPGYSTTATGLAYLALFYPVLGERNLLMIDQRGTGGSAAIDCAELQLYAGSVHPTMTLLKAAAVCGARLNRTYRDGRGGYVRGSDLFGASQSARDLAAVLAALDQRRVDYYGESYGSFLGQVFAARYPQLLRSLALDSTYPTIDQDPFDRAGQEELRYGFTVACRRSLACSAQAPGSPLARIARLDAALDARPLSGPALLPDGRSVRVTMSGPDIWTLLAAAGSDYGPYRNLDAAARAYLDRGDAVPLLRLDAWTTYGLAAGYGYRVDSKGLTIADGCTVYTNAFDMRAPVTQRRLQYARAVAALGPSFGYPLSNRDVFAARSQIDRPGSGMADNCLEWPAPLVDDPIVTKKPPLVPAALRVLILSGDLDANTSPGDNRQAAAALGGSVFFVTLPNENHVSSLFDPYDCPSAMVRAFVRNPGPVDTSCTARIPEVRAAGVFPLALRDQTPATPQAGNAADADALRLAAVAVEAIGDAIQGASYARGSYAPNCGSGFCGPGLRGGTFVASSDLQRIGLRRYRYAGDSAVSATVAIAGGLFPGAPGFVSARNVTARMQDGSVAIAFDVQYDQRRVHALATISGRTSRGARIRATVPAP